MRASTYRDIKDAVDQVFRPHATDVHESVGALADAVELLAKEVREIQPARVDMTQELADDIVRKIHGPLTISREFSAWIAEQGKYNDCLYTFMIGYGSDAGRGEMRLSGNGAMHLSLHDSSGAFLWRGTFVPPDFGES